MFPKILIRQTADKIIAALDSKDGYYPIDTVNIVKLKSIDIDLNLLILGILNSKLISFFIKKFHKKVVEFLAQVKPSRVKSNTNTCIKGQSEYFCSRFNNY